MMLFLRPCLIQSAMNRLDISIPGCKWKIHTYPPYVFSIHDLIRFSQCKYCTVVSILNFLYEVQFGPSTFQYIQPSRKVNSKDTRVCLKLQYVILIQSNTRIDLTSVYSLFTFNFLSVVSRRPCHSCCWPNKEYFLLSFNILHCMAWLMMNGPFSFLSVCAVQERRTIWRKWRSYWSSS